MPLDRSRLDVRQESDSEGRTMISLNYYDHNGEPYSVTRMLEEHLYDRPRRFSAIDQLLREMEVELEQLVNEHNANPPVTFSDNDRVVPTVRHELQFQYMSFDHDVSSFMLPGSEEQEEYPGHDNLDNPDGED